MFKFCLFFLAALIKADYILRLETTVWTESLSINADVRDCIATFDWLILLLKLKTTKTKKKRRKKIWFILWIEIWICNPIEILNKRDLID